MLYRRIIHYSPVFLFALVTLLFPWDSRAVDYDLLGQVSGWTIESRHEKTWSNKSGLRYIPRLIVKQPITDDSFIDTEVSINGFLAGGSDTDKNSDLELYRLKLRFSTARTETRIGLQKINFGPAMLLRSLRWFDRLDPRDPLQLTGGVYGLRFKYNALNNANFWLWGLYGNDDTKGYEILPTSSGKPEFGGRFQYPVPYGELAATFHTRRVDASGPGGQDFTENRFALDGRWDMEIGFWLESVLLRAKTSFLPYEWTKETTLGLDYTFGVGNGLHVLGEHMAVISSNEPFKCDNDRQISAFYTSYPLGYLDSLMAIGYYSWDKERYYQYLSWQRTYDNLILNFSFFRYPQDNEDYSSHGQTTVMSGSGVQVMIIYNH